MVHRGTRDPGGAGGTPVTIPATSPAAAYLYGTTGYDIIEPFLWLARADVQISRIAVAMRPADQTKAFNAQTNPDVPTWQITIQQPMPYTSGYDPSGTAIPATTMMEDSFEAPVVNPGRIAWTRQGADWVKKPVGEASIMLNRIREGIADMSRKTESLPQGLHFVPFTGTPSPFRIAADGSVEIRAYYGANEHIITAYLIPGGRLVYRDDVSILAKNYELKAMSAARLAQQIENLHDGWSRVGARLVPAGSTGWSVTSFVPTSMLWLMSDELGCFTPRVLGQLTPQRTNTRLTSGGQTLTIVLPVIIDLETLELWIDHEYQERATPKVNAAVFGSLLRGVVDAAGVQATGGSTWEIVVGATDQLDAPLAGSLSHYNVYSIAMREKHADSTRPVNTILVTIKSGGTWMKPGFTVQWTVDDHTVTETNVPGPVMINTMEQYGYWYSPSMLAKVLPELSAIVSWLKVNDQAHALHILKSEGRQYPACVVFKIVDTANNDKEHFISFDTATMQGSPAHPKVWYHTTAPDPWSELDKTGLPWTLDTALAEIRP
ncbi:MAG: hypothetical protein GYA24_19095 [Candidatus Lokiarchaeota archaeon]|nr:hypothetical protein [Candidatus Lokiarchaeota archaeon]